MFMVQILVRCCSVSIDSCLFSYLVCRADGWILTKLTWIHCFVTGKKRLEFGDLDLIFKVTGDIRMSNIYQKVLVNCACQV